MGAIKRNITDISNLKRGAVQMSKVYRGADQIWPSAPIPSGNIINTFALGNTVFVQAGAIDTFALGNTVFVQK